MLFRSNVFYINMLRNCAHNPDHKIKFEDIEINDNVTFNEGPVRILDHGVKKLRNKKIPIHVDTEFTWWDCACFGKELLCKRLYRLHWLLWRRGCHVHLRHRRGDPNRWRGKGGEVLVNVL